MKRAGCLIVVLMAAMPGLALAQEPVYFADANLKAAVEAELGLGILDPTPTDMLALTYLSCSYKGITDLTGIETAVSLQELHLRNNQISDISALSGLTNLTELNLWGNQISDISALSGLTNLDILNVGRNRISDISVLSGLTNLWDLYLNQNRISDISALSGLTNLIYLLLNNNQISDISSLSGLTNLKSVTLWSNQISDISVLSGLTNLMGLMLGNNQISDISALSGLTNLTHLRLYGNQISDISALSGLMNLTDLNLAYNQISDISVLSGLTNLTDVRLNSNQVSDISALSGLTNLEVLWLSNNQISDISALSGLTNLTWLKLRSNPLSQDAYNIYIPQIIENNPGIRLYYDPRPEPPEEPPAEKFQEGDIVRTTTASLRVRDDDMNPMFWGKENQTQYLPFGIVGQVKDGPRVEELDGQEYTFWKIDWLWNAYGERKADGEGLEGWSAEEYLGEDCLVAVPGTEDEAYWLARMIMSEASPKVANELEQKAVGWTAVNRRNSPRYPNDIYSVVTKWAQYSLREEPTKGIRDLAERIIAGEVTDPTDGATNFFSPRSMSIEDGYGPYPVPGDEENRKAYYPPWAKPRDGWEVLSSELTSYVTLKDEFQWMPLEGIRPWYFMFYWPYTTKISASIQSPGELRVYDSEGRMTGVINGTVVSEIPGSECFNDTIVINFPRGPYQYQVAGTFEGVYGLTVTAVTRQEDITFVAIEIPTSTNVIHQYTIDWDALSAGGEGVILEIDKNGDGFFEKMAVADNELSYDEFALQAETVVGFDPNTLNLKSKGKFVTVYIELPGDFDVSEIDLFSLELNELVPPLPKPIEIGDYDSDGINDLMVKFDLQELIEVLEPGEQIIDLTGRLLDGRPIAGFDFIRVIH